MNRTFLFRPFGLIFIGLLLLVGLLAMAQPALSETILYPDPPGRTPAPRGYVSMAYDSESDRFVMAGGLLTMSSWDPARSSGATWVYDLGNARWTHMNPLPFGRICCAGMAYDSRHDRVIAFGFQNEFAATLNETWAYDTNTDTWTELAPGPSEHLGHRMAYDSESDKIILFGGFNFNEPYAFFDDTWAYDYETNTWTEMHPATRPEGTNFQAFAYDAESDRVLMWGSVDFDYNYLTDIWAYDYNTDTWTRMPPSVGPSPAGRDFTAMAYDAESDRAILFSGVIYSNDKRDMKRREETWAYDYNTNTWELMAPERNPGPLSKIAIAYSDADDKIVVFGGEKRDNYYKFTNKTWAYDYNSDVWENLTRK